MTSSRIAQHISRRGDHLRASVDDVVGKTEACLAGFLLRIPVISHVNMYGLVCDDDQSQEFVVAGSYGILIIHDIWVGTVFALDMKNFVEDQQDSVP